MLAGSLPHARGDPLAGAAAGRGERHRDTTEQQQQLEAAGGQYRHRHRAVSSFEILRITSRPTVSNPAAIVSIVCPGCVVNSSIT